MAHLIFTWDPSFPEVYRVLPSFTEFFFVWNETEFRQVSTGFPTGFFLQVSPSFTEFYRVLPSFTEFYRVSIGLYLNVSIFLTMDEPSVAKS